jgi:hypothetical protein
MGHRTNWLVISPLLFSIGFTVLASTSARAADSNVWETSINPQTKERYIPVELWTGADWDGKRELKMAPVDGTYRHRTSPTTSKGPRNGNTESLDRTQSSTKGSIRARTTTNPNCLLSIKIKRAWVGYLTEGRVETREPIRAVLETASLESHDLYYP